MTDVMERSGRQTGSYTPRDEFHPVEEVVDTVKQLPSLGRMALRGLAGVFNHGYMPRQPLATHGDHDEEAFERNRAARQPEPVPESVPDDWTDGTGVVLPPAEEDPDEQAGEH